MPTIVRFVYEILHFTYGYTYIYNTHTPWKGDSVDLFS